MNPPQFFKTKPILPSIAQCFLRLTNVDNGTFERISRYESILWRQMAQTLLILKGDEVSENWVRFVILPSGSNAELRVGPLRLGSENRHRSQVVVNPCRGKSFR